MAKKNQELSYDTKTVLTIVLLLFVYPVGLVLMYKWMDWPKWVKILITIPVFLVLVPIFLAFLLIAINPQAQIQKGRDAQLKYQQQQLMYSPTPVSKPIY